ncbi:uncharacterized protein LOC144653914 isoform X2 [Oculina patagonica]
MASEQTRNSFLVMRKIYFYTMIAVSLLHMLMLNEKYGVVASQVSTSCDFEGGLCNGWQQSSSDVFDWTQHTGSTLTLFTGPDYDHTTGSGFYMYIESSTPQTTGDNAKLELSVSENGETSCLTFYYHMYGNTLGTLNVFSGNDMIFSRTGNQGQYWHEAKRTIYLNKTVTFEGIVDYFETDFAIDDVSITSGSCPAGAFCNFDRELCNGLRQSSADVFDWKRRTGSTPSPNTGPDYDHTSGSGYYMYIETSSPRAAGDNAKLELSVPGNGELYCLQFYYHMNGDTMGTLTVFNGNSVVFNTSGNHGNHWIKAERTIPLNNTVTFEGIAGSSWTGDVAIDDVSITNGSCQGHTATPTLSTASASTPSLPSGLSTPSTDKQFLSSPSLTLSPSTISPSFSSPPTGKLSMSPEPSTFNLPTIKPFMSSGPSMFATSLTSSSSTPEPSSSSSHLPGTSKSTMTPPTPTLKEKQESVRLEVRDLDIKKWKQMKNAFKREVAEAATDYCAVDGTRCQFALKSSREKRSSNNMVFTSDMVHILPGYPKKSPDDPAVTLLAFYLQHPESIVSKDVLKAIVESDASSIEGSIGGTISSVQPLFITTDATDTTEVNDGGSKPKSAIIGASVGGVLLLVIIIALVLSCKKSNRFNKQWTKTANNSYSNDAYCMYSEEQATEMKSDNNTHSPGNETEITRSTITA